MRFNRALLLLLSCLAACTPREGAYPSLALRPAELGQVTPPPTPYVPTPPTAEVLGRVEQLANRADSAHRAFLAEAAGVRRTVDAARGGAGSESWAQAQVALTGLQATRAPATAALADLDRIYADAASEGADVTAIAQARAGVAAQVEEQDRTIDLLIGSLD